MAYTRPPFQRTICACPGEVKNCQTMPGYLGPDDVERIAEYLQLTPDDVCRDYLEEGKGAIVAHSGTGEQWKIRTLRPKLLVNGCIFLTEERRCQIHPVAPFGCAYFDVHQTPWKAMKRSLWALRLIVSDRTYQRHLDEVE